MIRAVRYKISKLSGIIYLLYGVQFVKYVDVFLDDQYDATFINRYNVWSASANFKVHP